MKSFDNLWGSASTNYSFTWVNDGWSVTGCSTDSNGNSTYQVIICTDGGGLAHGSKGYDSSLVENSIEVNNTALQWSKATWGRGIFTTASVTKTLGFSFTGTFKAVTAGINAEENVTVTQVTSALEGSAGVSDYHYGPAFPNSLDGFDHNRLSTEWVASSGSADTAAWEGNVGLIRYVWDVGSGPHTFYSVAMIYTCKTGTCGYGVSNVTKR